jgi:hypothetical protein
MTEKTLYLVAIAALIFHLLLKRYQSGLRQVPGPLLASVSSFWKFYVVWCNKMPETSTQLHQNFGPLVRIGPNHVSASSRDSVQAIYRTGTGFPKVYPSIGCVRQLLSIEYR